MKLSSAMDQPVTYQISVRGQLDEAWSAYFEGMEIRQTTRADGVHLCVLTGRLVDQAALHGTLQKLYVLGLPLISLEAIQESETE
jgi:hypothetical protein